MKSIRKDLLDEHETLKEKKKTLELWLKMHDGKCKTVKCEADTTNSLGSPTTSKASIDLNNNNNSISSNRSTSPSILKSEQQSESKQPVLTSEILKTAISSTTESITANTVQTKQKTISDVLNATNGRKGELGNNNNSNNDSQKEEKNPDEDEDDMSKGELKRNNPMISGNSGNSAINNFSNELREFMFQTSIAQRPTNLNLSNILLRQDSLTNTPSSFFNLNSAGSPSLNTPTIFALATVDPLQTFSPTQTRVFILKS